MDLNLTPETVSGYAGGTLGLIATLKLLYNDYCARTDKVAVSTRFDNQDKEIAALSKKQAAQDTSLLTYMLDAEKTYARERDMNSSLDRFHASMDELRRELSGDMKVISADIKNLIEKVAEKT